MREGASNRFRDLIMFVSLDWGLEQYYVDVADVNMV
jgi:hypothetical protein